MSYNNGMAALNLEMPEMIPRTEYSANENWPLIKAVTGIDVDAYSISEKKQLASSEFLKAWDYGMYWNIFHIHDAFGEFRTQMGHAEYASKGIDYNDQVFCPFKDTDEVLAFDPLHQFGVPERKIIIDKFNQNYKEMQKCYEDTVNMTGIYVTCMSGLIEIFGWEMLLASAGDDSDGFGEVTNRYANWIKYYYEALAESDAPVVMVHDDIVWSGGPFLNPEWYREFIFPNYKRLFAPLIESGKKILYTSDGDFTMFVDDIAKCGVNGFVLEPLTDMAVVAEKYGKTHSIVGNADTRILLTGTKFIFDKMVCTWYNKLKQSKRYRYGGDIPCHL